MDNPLATHELPPLAPGDELHADGISFRVLGAIHRLRGSSSLRTATSTGGVALLAETTDDAAVRVVLRVFAPFSAAAPGPHLASAWRAGGEDDRSSYRPDYYTRGPSSWVLATPAHEVFLLPRSWGWLGAHGVPQVGAHPAPSAYRAAPLRVGTELHALDTPRPFVAFDCALGATVRTLLLAAIARSIPLGPGFALALGERLAAALAWLEAHPLDAPDGPRPVWHGRPNARHVFVTADGRCRLLTPVLRVDSVTSGGLFSIAEFEEVKRTGELNEPVSSAAPSRGGVAGDLWCLGSLLWEVATGCPLLFGAENLPPPSSVQSQTPPALDRCVVALLARDERARFGSAAAAHAALGEALQGFDGPRDEAALAAVVRVLGADADGSLAFAGDGRDGTSDLVALNYFETS